MTWSLTKARRRPWKKKKRWRPDLVEIGRHKDRDGPERRCIATGESGDPAGMVRFVLDPEGVVIPDILARLPGRGVWLKPNRKSMEKALTKRLFSRGFKKQAHASEDLVDRVEKLLLDRLVSTLALARKAGEAVTGFEKVKTHLLTRTGAILLQATDGAPDQRAKLERLAQDRTMIRVLSSDELGLAFGRGFAIHAALDVGALASRAFSEARRLSGLRPGTEVRSAGDLTVLGNLNDRRTCAEPAQDTG